jgi:hypothetical protein
MEGRIDDHLTTNKSDSPGKTRRYWETPPSSITSDGYGCFRRFRRFPRPTRFGAESVCKQRVGGDTREQTNFFSFWSHDKLGLAPLGS